MKPAVLPPLVEWQHAYWCSLLARHQEVCGSAMLGIRLRHGNVWRGLDDDIREAINVADRVDPYLHSERWSWVPGGTWAMLPSRHLETVVGVLDRLSLPADQLVYRQFPDRSSCTHARCAREWRSAA